MSYLNFISCATCHGLGTEALMQGLGQAPNPEFLNDQYGIPYFAIPEVASHNTRLQAFISLFSQQLNEVVWENLGIQKKWGLILASTKGCIEDLLVTDHSPQQDPYFALLKTLEQKIPVPLTKSLTVSTACTSSHGALALAKNWIDHQNFDHVLVLAGDLIGPFTLEGFQSLRALSPEHQVRPFDRQRDGLLLGDGVATLIVSRVALGEDPCQIKTVTNLCEGVSATRPDTSGVNLARCFANSSLQSDLIITHGTATQYNDLTESNAIQKAFAKKTPPPITASKWSIGHTLGASGLMDVALAYEIHKQKTTPGILTLQESDLSIREFLLKEPQVMQVDSVLISSLGFGGMCAAIELQWRNQ